MNDAKMNRPFSFILNFLYECGMLTYCLVHFCRYDPSTNELVSDKLGVAYPVLENGVPSLVPEDGRILSSTADERTS